VPLIGRHHWESKQINCGGDFVVVRIGHSLEELCSVRKVRIGSKLGAGGSHL
jgi:hypothetical protein